MYGQLSVISFTLLAPGTKLRLLSYLYPPSHLAGLCFEFMKPHSVAQAGLKITQSSCFGTSPKPQSAVITGMSHHTQLKVTTLVVVADHLGPSFTLDPAHLLGLFLDPPLLFVFVTDVGQWTIIKRHQLCVFDFSLY